MPASGLSPFDLQVPGSGKLTHRRDDGRLRRTNLFADCLAGREARATVVIEIFVGHTERDREAGYRRHVGVVDHDIVQPNEYLTRVFFAAHDRISALVEVVVMLRS
jgi:hypothetical protein